MQGHVESDVEPIDVLVESVTALAEHARIHGPAPDCAVRMDRLIEKHRAAIEAARRLKGEPDRAAE